MNDQRESFNWGGFAVMCFIWAAFTAGLSVICWWSFDETRVFSTLVVKFELYGWALAACIQFGQNFALAMRSRSKTIRAKRIWFGVWGACAFIDAYTNVAQYESRTSLREVGWMVYIFGHVIC